MKVPVSLANSFGRQFEDQIATFAVESGLLPDLASIQSNRFLMRSVIPHIVKLSGLFNREEKDQASGLAPYWKESSNPAHLRLAYFLYFMPSNLFRTASVWSELARLGFQWSSKNFRAVEFGAGPASGACGIGAGEAHSKIGLPSDGTWALIEQDKAVLEMGAEWARSYLTSLGYNDWGVRTFHRTIDPKGGFLPKTAPRFNLWLMSYYLNELTENPKALASKLIQTWKKHLEDEGLVILIEPALKLQSRRLLELRKHLIEEIESSNTNNFKLLLPCLGHQSCGAFANAEDWCHEEVTWWRPDYFKKIDKMAGLDRRTLPFSYLVLIKSNRSREEILPALKSETSLKRHRLVSPAHSEGKELEFFLCGEEGKRRARIRPKGENDPASEIQRGDIFLEAEIRGDRNSSRVEKYKKLL